MIICVPGGPYPWYAIIAAAPELDMEVPINTDALKPGLAYWLPPGDRITGLCTPRPATPGATIQAVRAIRALDYNEIADMAGIHPCQLADWMDGVEHPDGPGWDVILSLLITDDAPERDNVLRFRIPQF